MLTNLLNSIPILAWVLGSAAAVFGAVKLGGPHHDPSETGRWNR